MQKRHKNASMFLMRAHAKNIGMNTSILPVIHTCYATMKPGLSNRPLWIFLPLIFALLPFAEGLHYQKACGTGADFVTTTWAMWWFQQEWYQVAWGGFSNLLIFHAVGKVPFSHLSMQYFGPLLMVCLDPIGQR